MELSARTAYRGQITKIVKGATELLDNPNSQPNTATDLDALEEDLSVFIQRLTAALETLTVTDQEIQKKGLLKDVELNKELEKVAEYQDVAISTLSRLKIRIKKVQRKLSPTTPISPPGRASLDTSTVNCTLKLPKLQLKKFDGNFQEWLPFWEQFRTAIHENGSLTSTDKFSYLESVLAGSAKKIIAGFTASSMCYEAAVSLLQEQFGDPERLIDKNMQQLVSLRPVQSRTDIAGLRNLYNSITSCCRTLTALQIPTQQYYVMLKSILLRCLPAELRVDYFRLWERDDHTERLNETERESSSTSLHIGDTQVKSIMSFLKREVESLERSIAISFTPSTAQSRHTPSTHSTAACLMSLKEKNVCAFCNSHQHSTKDCDSKMSITEKREMLRKNNCCFRCAKRGHSSKKCRSAKWICCAKCKGRHITSLCDPSYNREKTFVTSKNADREHVINLCAGKMSTPLNHSDSIPQSATNLCAYNSSFDYTNVFLKTARGIAVSPSENKSLLVRFVIDGGSQYSYIREDLVTKLNLQSMGEVNFSLIPFGCKEQSPFRKFKKVKVHLKSQYSNEFVYLEAVVVPEICVDVLHAPDPSYVFLQNLQLADSCHTGEETVNGLSVLIGSNYYWSVVTGKQRRISKGLRAVHTIFGWTLQGAHITGKEFLLNENSCSPSIHSTTLHLPALSNNDFTSFWSLEAIGIRGEEEENKHLAEELAAQCITKNGLRYEASLPWKNPDVEIKSNRECALKRLESLGWRLSRNPERYKEYDAGIRQLLTDGFAESVKSQNKAHVHRVFYLPHRPVYKEDSTTTKMRIVFDASSRNQDSPSLNDLLHVGANLLPDVLKILLNFRLGPYGIVADVEKAFLQIELNKKDRDTHRFLWYASRKTPTCPQPEIMEYRMTRVTFGVNCSPFLLTATLQLHFKNERGKLQSTCRKLVESFYMDDLAMSVDTEEEGVHVSKDAVLVMKNANMNLRKWNSNSYLVRQAHCSDEFPSKQKVLGLLWFVHTDEIGVSLKSIEDLLSSNLLKATKRNVLQMIARVYDPLGMLGPVAIGLKILFQDIWREKLSWDETLTRELLLKWKTCVENLQSLKNYAIPRAAINFSHSKALHIHIFADASLKAYGTVAFIKSFDEAGRNNITFLCSKSRVAPLKTENTKELSLPKLELTAALLAARICSYLQKSLKVHVQKFFLWTDSKIALGWIQGDAHRWKPYVQSRVTEIRHLTSISDWRHCRGEENPADLLTRGISAKNLLNSELWVHGPAWLQNDAFLGEDDNNIVPEKLALALSAPVSTPTQSMAEPLLDYKKFSSWSLLLRCTCFVLRFVKLCRKEKKYEFSQPSTSELDVAETYWLRYMQRNSFNIEIYLLQKGKSIPKISKIAELCPFLDENGLLRLGGRFQSLKVDLNRKHPIILSSDSYLVKLLVEHYHHRTLHGGVNLILCQLRERYWVIRARPLVKNIIKRCVTCQRLFGKPASQPFGQLPIERITLSRPFDCVGVDFAGPLYYYEPSTNEMMKSYLMVFTCAAVRCIHLETVKNLSTESCIMGMRRFMAQRGTPSVIYSDNAKSFRRAALEIGGMTPTPDDELMQGFLTNKRIKWKFIIERAPWWGGFWERLIRTIKNVLKVVIGKAKLTFEQLRTVIAEAEGMVNLRPLTYVSSDPMDISPLTPSHFIHWKSGSSNPEKTVSSSGEMQELWAHRLKQTGMLWKRWRTEYLQQLRSYHHSQGYSSCQLKPNDVVLVFDSAKPRIAWKLAIVESALIGRDQKVRACEIRYADGTRTRRPVQLLYPLELTRIARPEDVKK